MSSQSWSSGTRRPTKGMNQGGPKWPGIAGHGSARKGLRGGVARHDLRHLLPHMHGHLRAVAAEPHGVKEPVMLAGAG